MTLEPDDFEVRETETRTRAAVCLLVDQSFSMVLNDTWREAKTTALALHALAAVVGTNMGHADACAVDFGDSAASHGATR